ncbi:zinc finger protein 665-like [Chaetodon trifascialis]|uniref:zinc finger protein 665-like n=1 Tax=Chaetodon trifascialis TaxID=109706 RepID=UPI003995D12D
MSKAQTLRAFVEQRLTAAAEEIIELFERTITEYEEELCGQRKLLDAVFQPDVRLHRADVQQLLVSQEEDPPEQQDCLDSLDQEDPPELPHMKEEQEELWTNQEGEQLGELEEADISKFTLSVPVKSEEEADEEEPQSSQLHQRQTEQMNTGSDGEDCRGPGPDRNLNPDELQPAFHNTTSDSSESETDDSSEWEESREPPSGLKPLQNNEVSGSDMECNSGKASFSSCATSPGSKEHLQKHNGIQTGEEPFSCSVCGVRFTLSSSLTSHLRVHTGEKPFTCSVCEANFSSRSKLSRHMRMHNREKPFSCTVCGKGFAQNSHLKRHSTVHTDVQQLLVSQEEDPPEQQDCLDSVDQEDPPELPHIKEEQEELWTNQEGEQLGGLEEFTLSVPVKSEEEADEEEPQSSQLDQTQTEQMNTGSDGEDCRGPGPDRNFNPDHAQTATHDKTSDSSESETDDSCDGEESREHMGEKPFTCSVCEANFSSRSSLSKHMRMHNREKPFNCTVCGKGFARKSSLRQHLTVHTGEKPFNCTVCGKGFAQKSNLRGHLTVHTGEKPFNCTVCGKGFARKSHLREHLTVHTGEKPFNCTVCSKGFAQKSYLREHMTVHTGEKPFSCTVCGKGFARKSHLKGHLAVHTGEKPFSCTVCGKGFAVKSNLGKHLTVHTGEKPFSCRVCGKGFARKSYLRGHFFVHTGETSFSCSGLFLVISHSRQQGGSPSAGVRINSEKDNEQLFFLVQIARTKLALSAGSPMSSTQKTASTSCGPRRSSQHSRNNYSHSPSLRDQYLTREGNKRHVHLMIPTRPGLASAASEPHFSPGSPEETPLHKMLLLPAAALCCLCSALAAMAAELIQSDLTLTRRVGEKVSFSCGGTDQCDYDYVYWY